MNETSDRTAFVLLIIACAAYFLHASFAIVTHRELYGDASLFLVSILSQGRITIIGHHPLANFYCSRIFAYGITQLPVLIAAFMGLRNLDVFSWIFGTAFFVHKPLSLLLCYRLLPRGRKILLVFPILGLFAGSINSEIYIVAEGHIALSFFWPLLFALTEAPVSDRTLLMSSVIGMTGLMYESMAFFAPILLAMTLARSREASPSDRRKLLFFSGLLAMVAVLNWLAIFFPRDALNEGGFGMGLLELISDTGRGWSQYHIGPTVSVLAVLAVAAALFLDGAKSVLGFAIVSGVALFFVWTPPAHFQAHWEDAWFTRSIGDRAFSTLLMPLLCVLGFLGIRKFGMAKLKQNAVPVCVLIAALAIGQAAWQVSATLAWKSAVEVVRDDLATESGPLYCSKEGWDGLTKERILAKRILCEWWVTPLSIFLAPGRRVQSLLFPAVNTGFHPFDPLIPGSFPSMRFAPVDYGPYKVSLGKGSSKR